MALLLKSCIRSQRNIRQKWSREKSPLGLSPFFRLTFIHPLISIAAPKAEVIIEFGLVRLLVQVHIWVISFNFLASGWGKKKKESSHFLC